MLIFSIVLCRRDMKRRGQVLKASCASLKLDIAEALTKADHQKRAGRH